MFAGGEGFAFGAEHVEGADELDTGLARFDHFVNQAEFGCPIWVVEFLLVVVDQLGTAGFRILGVFQLSSVDDVDGTLGSHDGNLGRRPRVDQVGSDSSGVHHQICPTVGLAGDHGDSGHGRFAKGIEQLGPVTDDPIVLLVNAREESRNIDKCDEGNVEGIAEPDEAGSFLRGFNVEGASQVGGLVADNPDCVAVHPRKADQHVLGEMFVHFEELAVVDDGLDDVDHVIWLVCGVGDDEVQRVVDTVP